MSEENKKNEEVKPPENTNDTVPEGYTPEEWAGLSKTEKEGILEGIKDPDGTKSDELDEEALKAIAGEKEEKKPEEKKEEKKEEEKKPDEKAETPKVEEPPADEKKEDEVKPPESKEEPITDEDFLYLKPAVSDKDLADDKVPKPLIEARDSKLVEAKTERDNKLSEALKKKNTDLSDLKKKWADGELEDDAYENQQEVVRDQYQNDRDDIRDEYSQKVFSIKEDHKTQARETAIWRAEQEAFYRLKPEYLGDKQADGTYNKTDKSEILFGALNQVVSRLISENPNMSGTKLLIEADKAVKKALGITQETTPKEEKKEEKKAGKPATEIPDIKNLGDLPASQSEETGSVYDQLDRLTGEAYEKALEKLTDEQRAAYLAGK